MAVGGHPVVVAANGKGIPVNPVQDRAPLLTVADNGKGSPIVISTLGAPFIVQGLYDASASALFARFTTPPTVARRTAINNLVVALKAATIWDKLDCFWVTAAADSQAACRNWIADTFNLTPVNAPAFVADRGYTGNGSTSRLATGYTPSVNAVKFQQNNGSLWLWSRTSGQAAETDMGSQSGTDQSRITARTATDSLNVRVNDGVTSGFTPVTDGAGWFGAQRRSAADVRGWRNGGQVGSFSNAASTALPGSEQWLLAANGGSYSLRQQSAAAYGASLTGLEASFYTAILTYMQAVGAA